MTGRPRRGRRPGDPAVTRTGILEAARSVFAESGYERATIRAIAERAGVDSSLVHYHFGTKQDLFVAAHDFPISPATLRAVLEGGEGTLGERMARTYLTAALSGGSLEAFVRAAISNPTARLLLKEFVESAFLDAFEGRIEGPDARLRMALAASHLVGIFMARRIVGIDAIADADLETIVRMVAPSLDRYLGGEPAA
ncbi:MAG: TetR family transcriptional regulator [Actinobacteria bacterium]|nr:TetR family transcriptional regulator [Actinomycetota bacterium]